MTQYLASSARSLAVEIDRALIPILEDTLSEYENVAILNEDILKVDISKTGREAQPGRTDQGCGESAILYYNADHYGVV